MGYCARRLFLQRTASRWLPQADSRKPRDIVAHLALSGTRRQLLERLPLSREIELRLVHTSRWVALLRAILHGDLGYDAIGWVHWHEVWRLRLNIELVFEVLGDRHAVGRALPLLDRLAAAQLRLGSFERLWQGRVRLLGADIGNGLGPVFETVRGPLVHRCRLGEWVKQRWPRVLHYVCSKLGSRA